MTIAYSSIGIYTPAMPAIGDYYGVSASAVQLTFTIYIVTFAFGQLFYGPFSDRYGRRPAILLGLAIYILGSILAVLSFSIELLILSRAIQAFGGCSGPVVGRAILRDLFDRDDGAKILSYVAMLMGAAPAFAPVIGGYLQVTLGRSSIFVLLTALGFVFIILNYIFLDETNFKKTRKSQKNIFYTIKVYFSFLRSPLFTSYTFVAAFAMAAVFVYASGAPFLLIELLSITPDIYGWYVVIPTIFNLTGAFVAARLVKRLGGDKLIIAGALMILFGGILIITFAIFLSFSVKTILVPMSVIMFGIAILYPSAAQGAVSLYPNKAGSASSLNSFLHMFIAALMVLALSFFLDGTKWPVINFIFLSSVLTFLIIIPTYIIRKKSKV